MSEEIFEQPNSNVELCLRPWPLIGSLHLLGRFKKVPFEAFTALQKVNNSSLIAASHAIVVNESLVSGIWPGGPVAHGQLECCCRK